MRRCRLELISHDFIRSIKLNANEVTVRLEEIKKATLINGLLNAPASIAIGFGLFARFTEQPETLHPLLGDATFVNGLFLLGLPLSMFCAFRGFKLAKERNRLMSLSQESK